MQADSGINVQVAEETKSSYLTEPPEIPKIWFMDHKSLSITYIKELQTKLLWIGFSAKLVHRDFFAPREFKNNPLHYHTFTQDLQVKM